MVRYPWCKGVGLRQWGHGLKKIGMCENSYFATHEKSKKVGENVILKQKGTKS